MLRWLQLERFPYLEDHLEVHPPAQEMDRITLPAVLPRTASLLALLFGSGVGELFLRCGRTSQGEVFLAYGLAAYQRDLFKHAFENTFPGARLLEVRPSEAPWSFQLTELELAARDWACVEQKSGLVDVAALPRDDRISLAGRALWHLAGQARGVLLEIQLVAVGEDRLQPLLSEAEKRIRELSKQAERQEGEQSGYNLILVNEGENRSWRVKSATDSLNLHRWEALHELLIIARREGGWCPTVRVYTDEYVEGDALPKSLGSFFGAQDPVWAGFSPTLACERPFLPTRRPVHQRIAPHLVAAAMLCPPQVELPSVTVVPTAEYGISVPPLPADRSLLLGRIMGQPGPRRYREARLRPDHLQRHALIAGVTGAGKTNTARQLLGELHRLGVPFLVVEPAKREYAGLPSLRERRFWPGRPGAQGLCLNPFALLPAREWFLDDGSGRVTSRLPVQTHLDVLRAVFNASFPMYGPMPYLLERAMQRAFVQRGWDLCNNLNREVAAGHLSVDAAFPTLTDVRRCVHEIMDQVGYSERIGPDIRAALDVRLQSLVTGSKRHIFEGGSDDRGVMSLLEGPALLELEAMGSDEEKIFVMGLVLVGLYEVRLLQGPQAALRHVLLIEEAHRLLRNAERHHGEEAEVHAAAVETFNNVISEVRAYGQAVVVADQTPSRIAPSVIKNAALKVAHRLLHEEEREAMGNSMALDESQTRHLGRLEVGEAVIGHDSFARPVLARIPLCPPPPMVQEGGHAPRTALFPEDVSRLMRRLALGLGVGKGLPGSAAEVGSLVERWLLALDHRHVTASIVLRLQGARAITDMLAGGGEEGAARVLGGLLGESPLDPRLCKGCTRPCRHRLLMHSVPHVQQDEMEQDAVRAYQNRRSFLDRVGASFTPAATRAWLGPLEQDVVAELRLGFARCYAVQACRRFSLRVRSAEELDEILAPTLNRLPPRPG